MAFLKKYLHGWMAIGIIVVLAAAGTVIDGMTRKVLWTAAVVAAVFALYFEMTK